MIASALKSKTLLAFSEGRDPYFGYGTRTVTEPYEPVPSTVPSTVTDPYPNP